MRALAAFSLCVLRAVAGAGGAAGARPKEDSDAGQDARSCGCRRGRKRRSANGADLIVSEKHGLPLVSFSITFLGGADQFEPDGRQGLASLTAAMLSEGTKTRDGEALSNALQLLGTSISVSVGGESGSISFRLDRGEVSGDARRPRRHAGELHVPRGRARAPARPAARAAEQQKRAVGSDRQSGLSPHRLRRRASLRPGRHRAIAQGDHARRRRGVSQGVLPAGPGTGHGRRRRHRRRGEAGHRTRRWRPGRRAASGRRSRIPAVPEPKPTTIFLVDKPGAAQSTVR